MNDSQPNETASSANRSDMYNGSLLIKKEKLWHSYLAVNSSTGRLNKQFLCNLCNKRFTKVSNVKDHLRSHLEYRSYTCGLCN